MKITELDLKTEGKRYKCGNSMFVITNGDLFDVENNTYLKDECIPMAELIEMEFEEIKKRENPYKRVNHRERYYAITREGAITLLTDDSGYDNQMFNVTNYFNNKEYAEYIAFKETLMRKLDKFAWEHNEFKIDWNDTYSEKYYIEFSNKHNEVILAWTFEYQSNNVYFSSQEIAEKALEEFKEDLIKLYTWKFNF